MNNERVYCINCAHYKVIPCHISDVTGQLIAGESICKSENSTILVDHWLHELQETLTPQEKNKHNNCKDHKVKKENIDE